VSIGGFNHCVHVFYGKLPEALVGLIMI